MKISRQESDKLHNKQFKENFNRFEYIDFINACFICFKEGYRLRGIKDVNKLVKLHKK
jgi:hypothetical protein